VRININKKRPGEGRERERKRDSVPLLCRRWKKRPLFILQIRADEINLKIAFTFTTGETFKSFRDGSHWKPSPGCELARARARDVWMQYTHRGEMQVQHLCQHGANVLGTQGQGLRSRNEGGSGGVTANEGYNQKDILACPRNIYIILLRIHIRRKLIYDYPGPIPMAKLNE